MRHTIVATIVAAIGAATMGAIAFVSAGAGPAAAADLPQTQVQPPDYPPAPDYYGNPPVAEPHPYPPPVAYAYPPPPPAYYYEYAPVPTVIAPRPYFFGRRAYEARPYGPPGFGPYVARGYGRYERPWAYRGWQR